MSQLFCPQGHEAAPGERFCKQDGLPLTQRCASGHAINTDDRFCRVCGAPAVEAAAAPVPPCGGEVDPSPWSAVPPAYDDVTQQVPTVAAAPAAAPVPPYGGEVDPSPWSAVPPAYDDVTQQVPIVAAAPAAVAAPAGAPAGYEGDRGYEGEDRPTRRGWMVAAGILVVVLVVGGAASAVAVGSRHRRAAQATTTTTAVAPAVATTVTTVPRPVVTAAPPPVTTTVAPTTTVTTVPAGSATMATIATYIAQSAVVRPTIQSSIDGVQDCSLDPYTGESIINQAITTRENILTEIQAVPITQVANGAEMVIVLSRALQDSITADQDYASWMDDVADGDFQCNTDQTQDDNFNAGQAASVQATADKNAFIAIWNPIAPNYGQRTYSASQI